MEFKKATKEQSNSKFFIAGPAGSGKTYTALLCAQALAPKGKIALIDTESKRASKYADIFEFDTDTLGQPFTPEKYVEAIGSAEKAGYDVVIVDGVSPEWEGSGGCLAIHAEAEDRLGNSYAAWNKVTPRHALLIEAIQQCSIHIIVTARAKMEYQLNKNSKGKLVPTPIGMAPVQRNGFEYEFDVVALMDVHHYMTVTKSICPALESAEIKKPGVKDFKVFVDWLKDGIEVDKELSKVNVTKVLDRAVAVSEKAVKELKFDPCAEMIHEQMTVEKLKGLDPTKFDAEKLTKLKKFIVDVEELLAGQESRVIDETEDFVDDVADNPEMDELTDDDIPFGVEK